MRFPHQQHLIIENKNLYYRRLREVTETGAWPQVEVRGVRRTGILEIAR